VGALSGGDHHELVLARHGETEWSLSGQHTGSTDIPLTANGRRQAEALVAPLGRWKFAEVLTSPLIRARETCRLAGLGDQAKICDDLLEWDYGDYEGLTTVQIREQRPGWTLFTGGVPNGETAGQVAARADRLIARALAADGPVVAFAHGHILRVVCARWLELDANSASLFALGPATVSVLGHERETRVIRCWNLSPGEMTSLPNSSG
jgi:probable phosphoglycerate mutase